MIKIVISFLAGFFVGIIIMVIWFYRMLIDEINQTSPYQQQQKPKGNILHPARWGHK